MGSLRPRLFGALADRLSLAGLILVMGSASAKAALDHTAITLVEQQSNYPELNESVAPTMGNPWTWTASGFSGFSGAPSVWFDYRDADHTKVELHWSGFVSADWQDGVDGSLTLTLSNGVDGDRVYSMSLSLRTLVGNGYTVIEQQTVGGNGVNAAGAEGFAFSASGFSGLAPAPATFTLNEMGAVTNCSCPNWNQDGTFDLTVQDGSRPTSVITGRAIALRRIFPDPLMIPNDGNAGSRTLQVEGNAGPWDWSQYSDGLTSSILIALDTPDSDTLTISWEAGDLQENGESGTGSITIQASDGSSPSSTVAIDTIVEAYGAAIPTIGEWGMIILVIAIAGTGAAILSRRKASLGVRDPRASGSRRQF